MAQRRRRTLGLLAASRRAFRAGRPIPARARIARRGRSSPSVSSSSIRRATGTALLRLALKNPPQALRRDPSQPELLRPQDDAAIRRDHDAVELLGEQDQFHVL